MEIFIINKLKKQYQNKCLSYHRDRGDKKQIWKTKDLSEILLNDMIGNFFLWDDGEWSFIKVY